MLLKIRVICGIMQQKEGFLSKTRNRKRTASSHAQRAHNKFLTKMGVSPEQIKARKKAQKLADANRGSGLKIDTLDSVRNGYED
jgi:hypothetical protein